MTKKTEEKVRKELVRLKLMENGELTHHGKEVFRAIKTGYKQKNHIVTYSDDLFAVCNAFKITSNRCGKQYVHLQLYGVNDEKLSDMYQVTNYKALIN